MDMGRKREGERASIEREKPKLKRDGGKIRFDLKPIYLEGKRKWGEKGKKEERKPTQNDKNLNSEKEKDVGFSVGSFWTRRF